ncbi:MAG: tRNA pseudouridine(65) synthase TruC [Candidatus Obscuribacterales bacterium]|nr:tRNA pseudouridine(65) synthase TruC [Candidatus Obscuribacterales bacterium]
MKNESRPQLPVLYRDEFMIAVGKPSGMIVHRGWDNDPVTASDIVRDDIVHAQVFAAHRLDRATSGVLLFALDAQTARNLQKQMEAGGFQKRYLALVRGPMKEGCLLDHPIPKEKYHVRVPAITEFIPIAHKDRWSLVEARPKTGRLHQIRRHLKHLSHPIVGDVRYGKGDVNRFFRENYGLNRMALHALELTLKNSYDEIITIQAPLPADLTEPLDKLDICY